MAESMTFQQACNTAMEFARSDGLEKGSITLTIHQSDLLDKYIITVYTTQLHRENENILALRYKCLILESIIEQGIRSDQMRVRISDETFGATMSNLSYGMLPIGVVVYDIMSSNLSTVALSIYYKLESA